MRIIYKLLYFYLFPLLVIPMQIYLYQKYVDTSSEDAGLNSFFDGVMEIDGAAIVKNMANTELYDREKILRYCFRVLGAQWAFVPWIMTLFPFIACYEIY